MIPNYCATLASPGAFGSADFTSVLGLGGSNWTAVVWLGLLAAGLGLLLVYMLSQWMRLPKLEAWTRFELFQLLATALLTLLLAGWLMGMCNWDASFLDHKFFADHQADILSACNGVVNPNGTGTSVSPVNAQGQPVITPYCVSQYYLESVKNRGDDIFQLLVAVNYGTSYLFRTVWESRPMGIGYTLEPLAGFQQLQNVFLVAVSGFMM